MPDILPHTNIRLCAFWVNDVEYLIETTHEEVFVNTQNVIPKKITAAAEAYKKGAKERGVPAIAFITTACLMLFGFNWIWIAALCISTCCGFLCYIDGNNFLTMGAIGKKVRYSHVRSDGSERESKWCFPEELTARGGQDVLWNIFSFFLLGCAGIWFIWFVTDTLYGSFF